MSRHNRRAGELAPGDYEALERDLHAAQQPGRGQRRATERTAAHAEAAGLHRATGKHYRSRPSGDAA